MKHIKELQLLLSKYFNLSGHNLECLSFFVIGMFMVQTVNLTKLSKTFSTAAKSESNYKRLQRFIWRLKFDDKGCFCCVVDYDLYISAKKLQNGFSVKS